MIYKYTLESTAPVEVTVTLHDLVLLKELTAQAGETGDYRYHELDKSLQETFDRANQSYYSHFSCKARMAENKAKEEEEA